MLTIAKRNIYDHQGRKIKTWQQITNANGTTDLTPDTRTLLAKLDYNEIGQLRADNQHSTDSVAYLQILNNTYNERGWLSKITTNTNKLMVDLRYNDADAGITPQFNGNITQQLYSGQYSGSKSFTYSYDKINRLTNAALGTGTTLNEAITYDGRGNILTLNRGGQSYTTPLTYTYGSSGVSNQLATVAATGFTTRNYAYDGNGNATTDGGSLTIAYNLLNLPQTVKLSSTTKATYTYSATGQKLHATQTGSDRDYIDGIVYNNNTIEYISTEEGRATPNGATAYNYSYDLKDHLGNVRVTVDKNPTGGAARVVQEDEYYAFGLRSPLYDLSNRNVNLYNGKELQADLQNQYDYGARFYDPVIGRFTGMDRLSDSYPYKSPYDYAENRPINGIDLDGLEWVSMIDGSGSTHISVNTNFSFDVDPKILPAGTTINSYRSAINNSFNQIMQNSTNGKMFGQVTFNGGNEDQIGQVVPSLSIISNKPNPEDPIVIGGLTVMSASSVNIFNKDGSIKTPEQVGLLAAHELFHTVRMEHPFKKTQGADTELLHNGSNNYSTTSSTNPNITHNVMMYPLLKVNGQKLGDLWKTQKPLFLTKDQINLMIDEIKKQNQGSGTKNDTQYWINTPGTDVKNQ
jgi:RHS repeat-associated protein